MGVAVADDGAHTQKADAGDHLGADPKRVAVIAQHLDTILTHQRGEAGADTHQNIGAQTRRTAVSPPLHTDTTA